MIRNLIIILGLICPTTVSAQTPTARALQDSILLWFDVFRGEDDQLKEECAQRMEDDLASYFSVDSNFTHQLDSLPFLGQLISDDGHLRLITFNYPRTDGTFGYQCILLYKPDGNSPHQIHRLKDAPDDWERLEFRSLKLDDWYGALYYGIVQNRFRKKTYYTLIGWDGNDNLSNRKVVDVLDLSGLQPKLGIPIFMKDGRAQNRLIFEYANDASMALNFQEDEGMIIMDHLAPEHPRLKGQFQFYGPDFSYDALKFKKGKWHLIEDHNAENRSLNGLNRDQKPGDFQD